MKAENITYPGSGRHDHGYLVSRPDAAGKLPAWSSSMRTGASTRTSRTWRGALALDGLPGAGAGSPVAARRHAERRGQGARHDRQARQAKATARRGGGGRLAQGARRIERQGRRRRLLLGRRHGQRAWRSTRPISRPRVAYYGRSRRPEECPRSRRRCCCTMPGSTSASTPASPAYKTALKAAGKSLQGLHL